MKPQIACSRLSAWNVGHDESVECKQQHFVSNEKINRRSNVSQKNGMKQHKTSCIYSKSELDTTKIQDN